MQRCYTLIVLCYMIHCAGVELVGSVAHTEMLHTNCSMLYDPLYRCRTGGECCAHRDATH